ncbi:4'-phosphopantetheinyl transferase family protein [Rhizobium helianthi]|uniref:4'-phosphopantetheinyl transferase family protein n=1 Tax=Rhizobium helianthi TaxID=1132695 RepID=A0ABW4M7B7_9HYPH
MTISEEEFTHLPASNEVHIWLTSLPELDEAQKNSCFQVLNDEERDRLSKFLVEPARLQFLVARALLRTCLTQYCGAPAPSWQFQSNAFGKPHISEPAEYRHIQFNISHTDGLVACAFAHSCLIGLDVENTGRNIEPLQLAEHVLAPPECADLLGHESTAQRARFYDYWTLKEAYVKARGLGLSLGLDSFWFQLEGEAPQIVFGPDSTDDPKQWHFAQFSPTESHKLALAVCMPDKNCRIKLKWVTPVVDPQQRAASFR